MGRVRPFLLPVSWGTLPRSQSSLDVAAVDPGKKIGRFSRRQLGLGVVAAVVLLAVAETVTAMVAPLRAPRDEDWRAAAAWVKAGHQDQDLIVAAPPWADPVLRMMLGDLIAHKMAGRLDHQRYARVWELSQRGADAPEAAGGRVKDERRFGRLRARLIERTPLPISYDFVDNWANARVTRVEPGRPPIPCPADPGQHQCPGIGHNFVRRRMLEIGGSLHQALLAQPVANATVAIEYPGVLLGKELAVAGGLHNVWTRKAGDGTVWLRVLIDGREIGKVEHGNRTGWQIVRLPTLAQAGRSATVRFEITSARPFSRQFGFAAEARGL